MPFPGTPTREAGDPGRKWFPGCPAIFSYVAQARHIRCRNGFDMRALADPLGGANVGQSLVSPSELRASYSTQRTVPRYTFVAVTEIIESGSQACSLGKTTKISSKGCYVETVSPLPIGTVLNMVISRVQGSFTTKGKVIYVHDALGMGIVFVDPAEAQLRTLNAWLAESSRTHAS